MDFYIDKENRRVIIGNVKSRSAIVINEFDKLEKKFLEGTIDRYDCELVLLDIEEEDKTVQTKAFARRIECPEWVMEFNLEEYNKK